MDVAIYAGKMYTPPMLGSREGARGQSFMSIPTVSVGIPVYNGDQYLARAIESVLDQSYKDFELLILDNASTDATAEIAAGYVSSDSRVRYLANPVNVGAAANFNRAFVESRGSYFAWLASDDFWEQEFLASCIVPLDADDDCVLVFPKVRVVDEGEYELELVDDLDAIDSQSPAERYRTILHEKHNSYYIFGLIRSDALRSSKLILPHAHGDTILLTRLSLLGRFAKIDRHLFVSRRHTAQSNKVFVDATQPMGFDFAEYSRWFAAPGSSGTIDYPYSRTLLEYYRASTGVRMSLSSRISCRIQLLRLARGYRRGLIADARRYVSRRIAGATHR